VKSLNRFLFSGEYLPFDVEQEFAGQAVVETFRDRHALQNAVNKEVDALSVKLVSDLSKLCNFVLLPLLNYSRMVLLKALDEPVGRRRDRSE
jgi:hypothetical protein